jgi:hypothetical protein
MVEILRALLTDTAVRLSIIYSVSVCYFFFVSSLLHTHTHTIDFSLISLFRLLFVHCIFVVEIAVVMATISMREI